MSYKNQTRTDSAPESSRYEGGVDEWIADAPFYLTDSQKLILRDWADEALEDEKADSYDR